MKDVPKAIEAVWKIESTRLIAAIARVTHDIVIAEELALDALVTALELWSEEGIPENPGAWQMTAAKRRAIDSLRRGRMLVQKHEEIARELEWQQQQLGDALEHSLDQVIDDDILRLIFTACHPVLTVEARTALGPHRSSLRRSAANQPISGRGAEPGSRRRHGARPGRWA
jgi:predicted RNA polymerase sigma factor